MWQHKRTIHCCQLSIIFCFQDYIKTTTFEPALILQISTILGGLIVSKPLDTAKNIHMFNTINSPLNLSPKCGIIGQTGIHISSHSDSWIASPIPKCSQVTGPHKMRILINKQLLLFTYISQYYLSQCYPKYRKEVRNIKLEMTTWV